MQRQVVMDVKRSVKSMTTKIQHTKLKQNVHMDYIPYACMLKKVLKNE